MSETDILANMSRGWNRDPAGVALGTEQRGVSAALWTQDLDEVQELQADPDHTQHILSFMLRSYRADLEIDGRKRVAGHHLRTGVIQCVRAGERPRAVTYEPFKILQVYVPTAVLNACVEALDLDRPATVELLDPLFVRDAPIERLCRELLSEMGGRVPLSRLRVDALGQDLAIQLLRRHSNLAGTRTVRIEPTRGGLAPWQLKRVQERLEDEIETDTGLSALAADVGLSEAHLCRAFKASTGLPPYQWLAERRMERAKALLANPRLSLTDIAQMVGYAGQTTFGDAFRRAIGVTPGQYRRNLL